MYVYIYIYTCTYMCVYVCEYAYTCIHIYMYVHLNIFIYLFLPTTTVPSRPTVFGTLPDNRNDKAVEEQLTQKERLGLLGVGVPF